MPYGRVSARLVPDLHNFCPAENLRNPSTRENQKTQNSRFACFAGKLIRRLPTKLRRTIEFQKRLGVTPTEFAIRIGVEMDFVAFVFQAF